MKLVGCLPRTKLVLLGVLTSGGVALALSGSAAAADIRTVQPGPPAPGVMQQQLPVYQAAPQGPIGPITNQSGPVNLVPPTKVPQGPFVPPAPGGQQVAPAPVPEGLSTPQPNGTGAVNAGLGTNSQPYGPAGDGNESSGRPAATPPTTAVNGSHSGQPSGATINVPSASNDDREDHVGADDTPAVTTSQNTIVIKTPAPAPSGTDKAATGGPHDAAKVPTASQAVKDGIIMPTGGLQTVVLPIQPVITPQVSLPGDLASAVPSVPVRVPEKSPAKSMGLLMQLTSGLASTVLPVILTLHGLLAVHMMGGPALAWLAPVLLNLPLVLATYGVWLRRGGYATAARSDVPALLTLATPLLRDYTQGLAPPDSPSF